MPNIAILCFLHTSLIHCALMQLQNEGSVEQSSSCFGTVIGINCSSSQNISPINVMVGAKPSSVNCTGSTACCSKATGDCTGKFIKTVDTVETAGIFYEDCVGRSTVAARQAGWADTLKMPCDDNTTYPRQTQYMYIDYNCVDVSRIGRFPTAILDNSGTGYTLYLQGNQYPNDITQTSLTCSVESDCDATITVLGLHILLTNSSDGSCKQSISVNDTTGHSYVITCNDNSDRNEYNLRYLTTSVHNVIYITYSSTAVNEGKFWIGFTTSSNGNLTLNCPSTVPQRTCEEPTTTTTEPTTTTTEPTTTTTEPTSTTTEPTTTTTEPTTTTTTELTTTTSPELSTTTTESTTQTTEISNSSTEVSRITTSSHLDIPEEETSSFPIGLVVGVAICGFVVVALVVIAFCYRKLLKQRLCGGKSNNMVDTERQDTTGDNTDEKRGNINQNSTQFIPDIFENKSIISVPLISSPNDESKESGGEKTVTEKKTLSNSNVNAMETASHEGQSPRVGIHSYTTIDNKDISNFIKKDMPGIKCTPSNEVDVSRDQHSTGDEMFASGDKQALLWKEKCSEDELPNTYGNSHFNNVEQCTDEGGIDTENKISHHEIPPDSPTIGPEKNPDKSENMEDNLASNTAKSSESNILGKSADEEGENSEHFVRNDFSNQEQNELILRTHEPSFCMNEENSSSDRNDHLSATEQNQNATGDIKDCERNDHSDTAEQNQNATRDTEDTGITMVEDREIKTAIEEIIHNTDDPLNKAKSTSASETKDNGNAQTSIGDEIMKDNAIENEQVFIEEHQSHLPSHADSVVDDAQTQFSDEILKGNAIENEQVFIGAHQPCLILHGVNVDNDLETAKKKRKKERKEKRKKEKIFELEELDGNDETTLELPQTPLIVPVDSADGLREEEKQSPTGNLVQEGKTNRRKHKKKLKTKTDHLNHDTDNVLTHSNVEETEKLERGENKTSDTEEQNGQINIASKEKSHKRKKKKKKHKVVQEEERVVGESE